MARQQLLIHSKMVTTILTVLLGSTGPWYNSASPSHLASFDPLTLTATLSPNDSPEAGWPKWSDKNGTNTNNGHRLTTSTHLRNFRTFVAVSVAGYDEVQENFARYYEVEWTLNMSGDYTSGVWTPAHQGAGAAVNQGHATVFDGTLSRVRTNLPW